MFISNNERTKRDKEAVGCFCLFSFSLHVFFLVPNSEIECLALGGEAEGEVFFNFPMISLVLYFFGVQKPCRDILREFTRSDLAKGPEQTPFCSTQQALWGEMLGGQEGSFRGSAGDCGRSLSPSPLASENHLTLAKAAVCFPIMSRHRTAPSICFSKSPIILENYQTYCLEFDSRI